MESTFSFGQLVQPVDSFTWPDNGKVDRHCMMSSGVHGKLHPCLALFAALSTATIAAILSV
jgi:hypothetical protein